ncbi:MAG: serine hydrolase domain-containing protein [Burkholderiaceae bacterium]
MKPRISRLLASLLASTAISACGDSETALNRAALEQRIDAEKAIVTAPACTGFDAATRHPRSAALQAVIDKYAELPWFPGLAAAIVTPEGSWTGAAGLADLDARVPMHPCHAFLSGSVAKLYTVVAALQLVEQGVLDLDEPVAPHLPAALAQGLPNADRATVRQLMNHTAGMPDQDEDPDLEAYVLEHDGGLPSAQAQLAYLMDDEPRFAPGTGAQYSSAHTVALGLVIDELTGFHHSNRITTGIIQRLGLRDTWYKNETGYPQPPTMARPYLWDSGERLDVTAPAARYALGSQGDAGVYATVADYLRLLQGLVEGRLVSARTLARMQEPVLSGVVGNQSLSFGLGLFLVSLDGEIAKIGHSGLTLGGMTHLYYYPKQRAFIAVAANVMADEPDALTAFGNGLLLDSPMPTLMTELEALVAGD